MSIWYYILIAIAVIYIIKIINRILLTPEEKEERIREDRAIGFCDLYDWDYEHSEIDINSNDKEYIYVEKEYCEPINSYIKSHYDELNTSFRKAGCSFVYLPMELPECTKSDFVRRMGICQSSPVDNPMTALIETLGIIERRPGDIRPSLITIQKNEKHYGFRIEGETEEELEQYFFKLFETLNYDYDSEKKREEESQKS